jgi:hypothetical protein
MGDLWKKIAGNTGQGELFCQGGSAFNRRNAPAQIEKSPRFGG